MKNQICSTISLVLTILFLPLLTETVIAQEATEVDPAHYKVEFENEYVRMIRITYAPGEKSVMHEHQAGVVVFLSDSHTKFTLPDGNSQEVMGEAGQALWFPPVKHLPENLGDNAVEAVFIELKNQGDND